MVRGDFYFWRGEGGGAEGGALDFTMSERWMDDFAKLTLNNSVTNMKALISSFSLY